MDVTPRCPQAFQPAPGKVYKFTGTPGDAKEPVQEGTSTADAAGLLTIPKFRITSPAGNVLRIVPE